MPSNRQLRWESAAHVAMGLLAGLVNLGLLLDKRERDQLPPENDRYPVMYVQSLPAPGGHYPAYVLRPAKDRDEYWPKVRVMDTLNDLREYQIGQTVAWFGVLAAGISIGWGIWG